MWGAYIGRTMAHGMYTRKSTKSIRICGSRPMSGASSSNSASLVNCSAGEDEAETSSSLSFVGFGDLEASFFLGRVLSFLPNPLAMWSSSSPRLRTTRLLPPTDLSKWSSKYGCKHVRLSAEL